MGRSWAHAQLFRKVLGGAGILPVQLHRLEAYATNVAGGDARPTWLFMVYGWAKGPRITTLKFP